jgi:hypothetical protein
MFLTSKISAVTAAAKMSEKRQAEKKAKKRKRGMRLAGKNYR